jgi:hypothetical protein
MWYNEQKDKVLQINQKGNTDFTLKQPKRGRSCGVRENVAIWAIYSRCGVLVRTVKWRRPDFFFLGKEQTGRMHPDEIKNLSGQRSQRMFGWRTGIVRTTMLQLGPDIQKENRPNDWTLLVWMPRNTVLTLHSETPEKLREIYTD